MNTILVVDDVPERLEDIEEEVRFSLRDFQVHVLKAVDVAEAESILEQKPTLAAVILDLHLPSFSSGTAKSSEEGGMYLLRKFAGTAKGTVYILSSGTPPEAPEFPGNLSHPLNFHCIPKTAPRSQLIDCLRDALTLGLKNA